MFQALDDIDFGALYRMEKQASTRPRKTASDWDAKAQGFAGKSLQSPYTQAFLQKIELQCCKTVLDVGCGAGDIGLQLASRMDHVVGLDFSPAMLALFKENAKSLKADNTTALLRAWEDSWEAVPVCDVVIASRSTLVSDMEAALIKLHQHARQRVYLSYPAQGFFQPSASGRAAPDYLYIVNILRSQGLFPRLDYIDTTHRSGQGTTRWAFISWEVEELP